MELIITQFPLYTQKLNLMMQFLADVFDAEIIHQQSNECLASFKNLNIKLIEVNQDLGIHQASIIDLYVKIEDFDEYVNRYSFFCFKNQLNIPKKNVHYTKKMEILDPEGRTWTLKTELSQKNLISTKFFSEIQS